MFQITRTHGPLGDLHVATSHLNRLFDEALRGWPEFSTADAPAVGTWMPPVDVLEEKDEVRIMAELPGVKPEDVKISVENNVLMIRGEKQTHYAGGTNGDRAHRFERVYGAFERRFTLPNTVDAERINATSANGVLTVTLPKAERAKPRQIEVKVG